MIQVTAATISVRVRSCLGNFLFTGSNRGFLIEFETSFDEEFVDSFQTD